MEFVIQTGTDNGKPPKVLIHDIILNDQKYFSIFKN